MSDRFCRHCCLRVSPGHADAGCTVGPDRKHEWVDYHETGEYTCAYCDARSSPSPLPGPCANSPTRHHVWS